MVLREVCPFHADDDVAGKPSKNEDGSVVFTCDRKNGHPGGASHSWLRVPAPPEVQGVDGLAAELGLAIDLPAVVKEFAGRWVEYGVVERAYALAHPLGFERMILEFGHNAIERKHYTTSAFLARALGALSRQGTIAYHDGEATGRWDYNSSISWWSAQPAPMWSATLQLSWKDHGQDMSYVPGVKPQG